MTLSIESRPSLLLLAIGPLFACATSVFTALVVIAVFALCTLCAFTLAKFAATGGRLVIAATTSAIIVAALLIALIMLGLSDVVAAFAPHMILAAFSAAVLGTGEQSMRPALTTSIQIALTGFTCELLGRGTLLVDYELAFAGATHDWIFRIANSAPLPWLATPAGALLVAAAITAAFSLRRSRQTIATNSAGDDHVITEPRSGRRVRVTGHIS